MNLIFALCTVVIGSFAGGVLGYGLGFTPLETHLFIDESLCGMLAGLASAMVANQAVDAQPRDRPLLRAASVAAYGAVVGILLACMWYCFDWEGSLTVIGAISGFLSGIPCASAYGFLGGEPHNLGGAEFANLAACLGLGLVLAFIVEALAEFEMDMYTAGGIAAFCALVPALFGGRLDAKEALGAILTTIFSD